VAAGMGAWVYLLEKSPLRMRYLDEVLPENVTTLMSNRMSLEECLRRADVLIGSVLVHGAKAPKLVTRSMLKLMRPGAVIVDVAVDQGGCCETTHPTTHSDPTYVVDGVVHYCVTNMPGAYARTSTFALTNVTLPYVLAIADLGWRQAARRNPELARGLTLVDGQITHEPVARAHRLRYVPWSTLDTA
jgi:alanine dehydrogenase